MLSVFIESRPQEGGLAQSLAVLVPAAVEGLVREVVVLDAGMTAADRRVADHAGCRIAPAGDMAALLAAAKGDWVMLLEPGARLESGWIEAVTEHLAAVETGRATPEAARFSRSKRDRPRFLARIRQRPTALAEGLLLRKSQAMGLAGRATSLEELARGVAATRLAAGIRPPANAGR